MAAPGASTTASASKQPAEMGFPQEKYRLLGDDEDERDDSFPRAPPSSRPHWATRFAAGAMTLALAASITANIVLARRVHTVAHDPALQHSAWAGLVRNTTVPIYASTEYGPGIGTQEERNAHWRALDISPGVVALDDDYAIARGLPLSQRFPWDQSKGVYFLGAFHQIHCLQMIQEYTSSAHAGHPAQHAYHHVEHCLDVLLQDAKCHADDTPWYELPPAPQRAAYAPFQARQCRDWGALLAWSREHDACYRYDGVVDAQGNEVENEHEHYSYCDRESPYFETMREYFGRHPPVREGYAGGDV